MVSISTISSYWYILYLSRTNQSYVPIVKNTFKHLACQPPSFVSCIILTSERWKLFRVRSIDQFEDRQTVWETFLGDFTVTLEFLAISIPCRCWNISVIYRLGIVKKEKLFPSFPEFHRWRDSEMTKWHRKLRKLWRTPTLSLDPRDTLSSWVGRASNSF